MPRLPSSRLALLALLAFFFTGAPLTAQIRVDTAGSAALIAEAMNHSELMANLEHLSDAIGPRLTGSPAMRRANDWSAERFEASGLATHREPYTFGVTWE